ncbi:class I SAM-dependent methyltransferase [Novacetimonas cocois]|uniref:SAM-dependent methyltransferase n=1 Tax=Novacetimonas cocois TaxID=1747507 RepID=A0A365Z0G7_9PROT|nr:class I SAM-dependent methyltransferase [Novacetimonas cocois]RBM08553.1 SAM-dependent methyltransferase [Novacetimonas cocois]
MTEVPDTLAWYDRNASSFEDRTAGVDMMEIYGLFLPNIPPGGHILDVGCGVGRDALAFARAGYRVTAIDGSAAMVRLARERTAGYPVSVHHMTFTELDWTNRFDGFWACASLLHLPQTEQRKVLTTLGYALKPSGTGYASFKVGTGERVENGRYFVDMTDENLRNMIKSTLLRLRFCSITTDKTKSLSSVMWLNAIFDLK